MREIKFRAWDEIRKMWHIFTLDDIVYEQAIGVYEISSINADFNKAYQFTGLKDKNGKEVYEGDVIKTPYNEVYDFAHYEIVWSEEHASWYENCLALHHKEKGYKDISRGGYCVGNPTNSKEIEVIGNIYENPELLKGDK